MPRKEAIITRNDTAAGWTAANPILLRGEEGAEYDTGKQKVGDGTTAWNLLPYSGGGSATVSDATTTSKGIVQLAGDLGGTAASPTVPGLSTKEPTISAGTNTQYYRGDKTFQTLNQDVVPDGTTNKVYTSTEKTRLANTSGTNTGDQTLSIVGQNLTVSGANGNTVSIPAGATYTPLDVYYVASSTSSTAEKASAQYVTDGTADDVEINAALTAAKSNGGGIVKLGTGVFNLAAPIYMEGVNTPDDTPGLQLIGAAGGNTTRLVPAANTDTIVLRYMPQVRIKDLQIGVNGTGSGVRAIANTTGANDRRGFWNSQFENLYFIGTNSHSGWCMNLENPFRSTFKNLGTGVGIKNGLRFASTYSQFNPGNCTVEVVQMGLSIANGISYMLESADDGGFMNIMSFTECDSIDTAASTSSVGWYFKGSSTSYFTTRDIQVQKANPEQFNTAVKLEHAANIRFVGDFINPKTGGYVVDATADSVNNRVEVEYIYVNGTSTVNAFRDLNTDALKPNYFINSFARVESGGTLTISPSSASVLANLGRDSDGTGVYPTQFAANYQMATKNFVNGLDATNVKTTGNQNIGGTKTFTSNPILSTGANFTPLASPTYSANLLVADSVNDSLTYYNSDSNVSLQIGQEDWVRVINNTGTTIANGRAVYLNGASGGLPTIALAQANAVATTIGAGLTTESIANGATGFVTCLGNVNGIDTSAFTAGATVYISATTPGALTSTAPTSPNYRYRIGIVGISSATVGTIHVTPSTAALGNGSANQVAGINNAGTAQEYKSLNSGTNVSVTNSAGAVTFDLQGTVPIVNGGTGSATQNFVDLTNAQTVAGVKTFSSAPTLSAGATMSATSIVTDTTTGLKIGTATTQKLGFFNATPVVQQGATTDIGVALSNLGLRAAGSAYTLVTSGNITLSPTARTANVTLATSSGQYNMANATTASFTITLPSTTIAGQLLTIKKIDATANTVTVAGTIDGVTNYVLSTQYKYVTVQSTATSGTWYVVGNN